jgi:mRNA interferase MazF
MRRGEVYWVSFDPELGSEPKSECLAVVVGNNMIGQFRRTVLAVPLSRAHLQTEWPVLVAVKTTGAGCAVIDQVKACDKKRFGAKLGELSSHEMKEIDEALAYVLALG